jgi:hypothetical protein
MIIVSRKKKYELAAAGTHLAALVDVTTRDAAPTRFGPRDQVMLRWLIADGDGEPVVGKDMKPVTAIESFTRSLADTSNLRKRVRSILGRDPGDDFDLDQLLGVNVRLEIEHVTRGEKTYANITGVMKPAKGDPRVNVPDGFGRRRSPEDHDAQEPAVNVHGLVVTDDDVPDFSSPDPSDDDVAENTPGDAPAW